MILINKLHRRGRFFTREVPIVDIIISNNYIGLVDARGTFSLNINKKSITDQRIIINIEEYPDVREITNIRYIFENRQVKGINDTNYLLILTNDNHLILDTFSNLANDDSTHLDIVNLEIGINKVDGPLILLDDGILRSLKIKNDKIIIRLVNNSPIIYHCLGICYDVYTYILFDHHTITEVSHLDNRTYEVPEKLIRFITIGSTSYVETDGGMLMDISTSDPDEAIPVVLMNEEKFRSQRRGIKSARNIM